MKKARILGSVLGGLVLAVAAASAQSASDSITVTAANVGIFEFTITQAAFDFGNVDATGQPIGGTGAGVAGQGRTGTSGFYLAAGAADWTVRSAPPRQVRIFNASTTATVNWGTADRLSMQVPVAGGGSVSCGFKAFSTVNDGGAAACGAGNLLHGLAAGNGGNAGNGDLDFRLEVADADAAGANSWTVVLTAAGS